MQAFLKKTLSGSPWLALGLFLLPGGSLLALAWWAFQHVQRGACHE